jgi:hypothetical protein
VAEQNEKITDEDAALLLQRYEPINLILDLIHAAKQRGIVAGVAVLQPGMGSTATIKVGPSSKAIRSALREATRG